MKETATPVFLERRGYRQRRLTDAARLLPILGVLLWAVPLLWGQGGGDAASETAAMPTSRAILYIFGVWVFLSAAALWLSLALDSPAEPRDGKDI